LVEASQSTGQTRSFDEIIAAIRQGDLSQTRVSRLSDLSRDDVITLRRFWHSIPEATRIDLIRRCDTLSEERVELDFKRALRIALEDPSPAVRQLAVAALWEDESRDLLDRLRVILASDPSPDVRAAAAAALERFVSSAVLGTLDADLAGDLRQELLDHACDETEPYAVRRRALEALGPYGDEPEVALAIADAYGSGDHGLQCSAVYAMGRSRNARWLPMILAELEGDDPEMQYEAARAAGSLSSPDVLPALLEAARSDDAEVRHAAIAAMGQIGGRGAARALERLSEDAGEGDLDLIDAALDEVNTLIDPFQSAT
jgi:HEAT repeat protein